MKTTAFTFIELIVVVALIASLSLFSMPKIKEIQKRQNSLQSGQNLRQINTSIVQWGIDNFGPPNPTNNPIAQATTALSYLIPSDGNALICTELNHYMDNAVKWYSPSYPNGSMYVYQTWIDSDLGISILRSGCFSALDSDSNYEPSGYEGIQKSINGHNVKASYANGYEDVGVWFPSTPRINSVAGVVEDYP